MGFSLSFGSFQNAKRRPAKRYEPAIRRQHGEWRDAARMAHHAAHVRRFVVAVVPLMWCGLRSDPTAACANCRKRIVMTGSLLLVPFECRMALPVHPVRFLALSARELRLVAFVQLQNTWVYFIIHRTECREISRLLCAFSERFTACARSLQCSVWNARPKSSELPRVLSF